MHYIQVSLKHILGFLYFFHRLYICSKQTFADISQHSDINTTEIMNVLAHSPRISSATFWH